MLIFLLLISNAIGGSRGVPVKEVQLELNLSANENGIVHSPKSGTLIFVIDTKATQQKNGTEIIVDEDCRIPVRVRIAAYDGVAFLKDFSKSIQEKRQVASTKPNFFSHFVQVEDELVQPMESGRLGRLLAVFKPRRIGSTHYFVAESGVAFSFPLAEKHEGLKLALEQVTTATRNPACVRLAKEGFYTHKPG